MLVFLVRQRGSRALNLVVLCDFDGTIVEIDTAVFVLDRFSRGDWRGLDRQYERGEITLEECLRRQFSAVFASKEEILAELEQAVTFRSNFEKLVRYCRSKSIPFLIVSAGLDFVISHFLRREGWEELVTTYAAKTQFGAKGIEFVFPRLFDRASANFKQDLVKYYRAMEKKVLYVGDGSADHAAVVSCDYPFAINGSKLASLCKSQGSSCEIVTDFTTVVNAIRRLTT
jgi:2-hydroxy-3-keto-5-methylthiopentenyl-1-phosphate phosphatase